VVLQIRSHAQKYFNKVIRSGAAEMIPPPRPKRKSASQQAAAAAAAAAATGGAAVAGGDSGAVSSGKRRQVSAGSSHAGGGGGREVQLPSLVVTSSGASDCEVSKCDDSYWGEQQLHFRGLCGRDGVIWHEGQGHVWVLRGPWM
jgi:hypothetical protein